ncbi:Uncharacterised protein [Mycobacteroides abscessus]|uniref:30S ribosomal S16 domain protein n=1 Tax=Mycobacteroides abscessus MAB_030201_1075 TaxID=1335410 RepID=A0A829PSX8_9MYCO|nr:30S ribosomal S16 domain protein [Mycobacteroides abscessus MAB_110811_1470]ETZ90276.1 30S ribosomal S16 domain protein [Mycobacteroides abscessus MAB_030201_1075]EUA79388.1 30S ribosomal S16 domain protein [Mycobacteroides abscessus subsp. bolletii 103]CPU45617.1 Uncharacterised protein [Mycobacteroides abscessus]
MVPADHLDGTAFAAGAGIGDLDAVLGVTDLPEAGELDLDSHDYKFSLRYHAAIRRFMRECMIRFCLAWV